MGNVTHDMPASLSTSGTMTNGCKVRSIYGDVVAAAASPDPYLHRRSSSDIYNSTPISPYKVSSNSGGQFATQPYIAQRTNRERRTRSWDLSADPELLRKKRLASYKVYGFEGKVKSSVKKGLHWVKGKYDKLVYGFKVGQASWHI